MRKKLYELIEPGEGSAKITDMYDCFMMAVILMSLVPLAFKSENIFFLIMDKICVSVFIIDYFLHWITADFRTAKKPIVSFIMYPLSFTAVTDIISILPSLTLIHNSFKLVRILRMLKTFRVFKVLRYSKSMEIICNVLRRSKESLIAVSALAAAYILVAALVIFNVEPDSFDTFFDAVYWATVSLTTVGYGDIYPITTAGKVVAMLSSFFGIAIVALPAGIITAGYMNELKSRNKEDC